MIRRILDISGYPFVVVFLIAGVATVIFAFSSVNLFQMTNANLHFLRDYGLRAIMEGGLIQLALLTFYGSVSLICFICFKICESDLINRYQRWTDKGD